MQSAGVPDERLFVCSLRITESVLPFLFRFFLLRISLQSKGRGGKKGKEVEIIISKEEV